MQPIIILQLESFLIWHSKRGLLTYLLVIKDGAEQSSFSTGTDSADIPLEYERILTEEDFAQIRELRHQKLVDELMRKHGLKSAAKRERLLAAAQDEAEEALDKLVSSLFGPSCSLLQIPVLKDSVAFNVAATRRCHGVDVIQLNVFHFGDGTLLGTTELARPAGCASIARRAAGQP